MKKIILVLFVVLLQISCNKKEGSNQLQPSSEISTTSGDNSELLSTLEEQEEVKAIIIALSKKKDSLQKVVLSTKESMSRINDTKIDKGIEGVNMKLNELKGQKENIEEQVALQKKEIDLATKKIDLLNQEKVVYDAQKKALYDKGAAPKDFVQVDSLLSGINNKLSDQKRRVKSLNRNVADVEEQVISINDQRSFLSAKIRENYNAQEIFGEFAKEEEGKVNEQIKLIDEEITKLTGKVSDINSSVTSLNSDIEKNAELLKEQQVADENSSKNKNRLMLALIAVALLTVIFIVLNELGKRRKNKTNKTK